MSEKEYIVSLVKGTDAANFAAEMTQSAGTATIPNRSVDVADERLGSARNTHYSLSEAEAAALKNDPRVLDVAIPPDQDSELEIGTTGRDSSTFYKGSAEVGQYKDWGKRRHSVQTETVSWGSTLTRDFTYSLDGTGVDVVIQDSGLQVDHPEFQDANGVSRVQQIDWYAASGITGTQSSNHYRDLDGHGTHCAGTAVGKTYGWAPGAAVYSVKVSGLEGSGDSGTGISVSNCFDVIKLWHRNKPVDPITGKKRPTVVNMSWGYSTGATSIVSVNYRGTSYTSSNDPDFNSSPNSHMRDTYGIYPYFTTSGYRAPVRVTSVDTDVDELIDEGVIVCIAAGNNSFKADVPGGDDYDNYFSTGTTKYYHRGSSPYSEEAFMVGSLLNSAVLDDNKVNFSTAGPGVDIYAAGDDILSATSTTNKFTDGDYWADSNFKTCNISGTSMASPQVCGVAALYLQANPKASPAVIRQMIHNDASNTMNAGTLTDYNLTGTAMGGPRRVLVNRYTDPVPFTNSLSGNINFKG